MLTSMRSRTASAGNGLITSRNSPGVQSPKISERFRIRKIRGRVQGARLNAAENATLPQTEGEEFECKGGDGNP